jgi:ABC-2 type transport system permease protein
MNLTLFKAEIKRNWVLLLIFFLILTMYTTMMISMFNPADIDSITAMVDLLPPDIIKAFGFDSAITSLTDFLASWLFGMLMITFPLIYTAILGNRLVAKMVENGSIVYLLSTPHTRTSIIITKGLYALSSMFVLSLALYLVGTLTANAMFPGLLDTGAYFRLSLITMLVNMTMLMISFLCSTIFNEGRYSILFGTGIPMIFLLMNMLGGVSPDAEIMQKISPYGFYDPVKLVQGESYSFIYIVYLLSIVLFFSAAVLIFRKRRLPV